MKLTNQQVHALATDIYNKVDAARNAKIRRIECSLKVCSEVRKYKKILLAIPKDVREAFSYQINDENVTKSLKNHFVRNDPDYPKEISYTMRNDIVNDIHIMTIDAKDLNELIKTLSKKYPF